MTTALLAMAWLVGLGWAAWALPGGTPLAVLFAIGPVAVAYRQRPAVLLCAAAGCAGVALLAGARWQAATMPPPATSVAWLVDAGDVRLRGVVRDEPEERERSRRLRISVRQADAGAGWQAASGGVLVRVPITTRVRAGDTVLLSGHLTPPPDLPHFDYRAYLARQGIVAQLDYPRLSIIGHEPPAVLVARLRAARRAASRALDRALPQPEAALARGIVVGDRVAIPSDLAEDFRRSGTSHLIAISGFNITLVAGTVVGGLTWLLGRRRAALLALASIALYAVFVGMSASVVRALVMGALMIGAALLGRPGAPLVALAVAAAAMTVHDPRVIDDLGFQLSFTATAGIMLLVPPLQAAGRGLLTRLVPRDGLVGPMLALWDVMAVTVAATVATAPVLVHVFGRLSLVAPAANLVLVPLFPLVMLTSAAAAVAGVLAPPLAPLAGSLAWPPLALTVGVARAAAHLPGSSVATGYPGGWAVAWAYGVMALAALVWSRLASQIPRDDQPNVPPMRVPLGWSVAASAALIAVFLAVAAVHTGRAADGRLTVAYAVAGGAPVALVTGPAGERVLVDTGATPSGLAAVLDPLLPSRDRRIDIIVLTRRAPTTLGGLDLALERYGPRAVAGPPAAAGESLPVSAANFVGLEPGAVLYLSGGARLQIEAAAGERGRFAVVASMGTRRLAVTPGEQADAGAVRAGPPATGSLAVTAPALPLVRYDVRAQGPVWASTDGVTVRLRAARGDPFPATR